MNVEPTGTNTATVTGAIRQAARMTGADFQYLLATAQVGSNLSPNAQAPTSSARRLFQFIEQIWLATLKEQGTALGYDYEKRRRLKSMRTITPQTAAQGAGLRQWEG